nr:toll/interleukin-1 receptor domain-containing protein [Chitinophagaceae bacterium]
MSFVPGYEYDIFISYAHIDNVAFPGQADGWIEQFYKNLVLMLAKRFGRMDTVKVWWDSKKLDGSVQFNQSIASGIEKSAIMICLNSPGYVASQYCQMELDTFYKKAIADPQGLNVGDRSRIVHVLLNNIPHTQWPSELSGTTGFPFHDAEESDDFGDTIDTLSNEFRSQMQQVRDAVWNILNDFRKKPAVIDEPEELIREEGGNDFSIYIGEVADTLRTSRKRLISELEKKGYTVICGIPPPDEAKAHEAATIEALKKSDVAIHLLDEYPGREIVGSNDIWYPQKQVELSLETENPQMIWVPSELDTTTVEDEKYRLFLQKLEAGNASAKELEFVRGSKGNLSQQIIDFVDQMKGRQMIKNIDDGKLSVLLDTHFSDQIYALDLSKMLLENNIQPFVNPQEDDPRKNINMLGDRISQVRKLIFLYGNVSKEWILERMSVALQLIITNNYPIEDFFIYMAPPQKDKSGIALNQRFLKINIIDSSRQLMAEPSTLEKFLHDLKSKSK